MANTKTKSEYKQTPIGKLPKKCGLIEVDEFIEIEAGKRAKGSGLPQGSVPSWGGEHI